MNVFSKVAVAATAMTLFTAPALFSTQVLADGGKSGGYSEGGKSGGYNEGGKSGGTRDSGVKGGH